MQRLKDDNARLMSENAELKATSDGSLFDLRKSDVDTIARITLEQCGLPRTKAPIKQLPAIINEAEKVKKAKAARPAG